MQPEVSIVVLTYNRRCVVTRTIAALLAYGEPWPVVVVDNGSTDGTANLIERTFPAVTIVRCPANLGAAGRNYGVGVVRTPYVAFCDDDTCWRQGALSHAVELLDEYPEIAVVNARILVGESCDEDPTCALMARSPLASGGLPGKRLLGFMAGASVMRVDAYRECGGYEPRLFIGGEEALLSFDLAARGWAMVYGPQVVTSHYPSCLRDAGRRRSLLARNAIWVAWMRLPVREALRETARAMRQMREQGGMPSALVETLCGLPWALTRRKTIPLDVLQMYRQLAAVRG